MARDTGRNTLALTIALAVAVAAPSKAQEPRTPTRDSSAIAAIEYEWIDASDSVTLDRILASDFVHSVAQGYFLTKEETLAWSATHRPPATLRFRFGRLDVRVRGDAAIATGIVVTTDTTGTPLERAVFTDVFVHRGGRWQAVSAQETLVVPMNRKP
jgi:ketosteroid isomerase-like protein